MKPEKLYAFIADHGGVICTQRNGETVPCVTANPDLLTQMRKDVEWMAQRGGWTIRLYEFSSPKEIEAISPTGITKAA